MKIYNQVSVTTTALTSIMCDVCKKVYDIEEWSETQEFTHISLNCGYNSVFGDGITVECDICQHCLQKLLGKYIRTIGK